MEKTNLVLLTGLPAAGKSTVAGRLVDEYGFVRLSTDELRQSLFGKTYRELRSGDKKGEEMIRRILDYSKIQTLSERFDLVIDASAPTNKFRRRMLTLPYDLEYSVNKYLLNFEVDESIISLRQKSRGESEEAIETIKRYWEDPEDGFMGARLYSIENSGCLGELYGEIERFYEMLWSHV